MGLLKVRLATTRVEVQQTWLEKGLAGHAAHVLFAVFGFQTLSVILVQGPC